MNELCGCCEGIERLTPITIANRPGLGALLYRVGTHGSFLETMLARLSASDFPELGGLTIRTADDPSIALLDAWATVADVLTFYQERIANEGYLRTATERRSILELARLVGYRLRPGVAASVFLAYTLELDHNVTILPGNRAQSVPGPGELPQSFETAETLEARFAWNVLKPRLTRPQHITQDQTDSTKIHVSTKDGAIYLQGTSTGLKSGDALLFVFDDDPSRGGQVFTHVLTAEAQAAENRTKITVDPAPLLQPSQSSAVLVKAPSVISKRGIGAIEGLVNQLSVVPSVPPRNSQRLERSVADTFRERSDMQQQLLVNFNPILQVALYNAYANIQAPAPLKLENIKALRVKAALFGHNLPLKAPASSPGIEAAAIAPEPDLHLLALDGEYKEIATGSWVVIENRAGNLVDGKKLVIRKVEEVQVITLGGLTDATLSFFSTENPTSTSSTTVGTGTAARTRTTTTTTDPVRVRVTLLRLNDVWLKKPSDAGGLDAYRLVILRNTTVYAQSEGREPAEEPFDEDVGSETVQTPKVGTDTIELDRLYDGLKSGRWAIVSGERTDVLQSDGITPIRGIRASELVMLASVTQDVQKLPPDNTQPLPGDKNHTFLHLAKKLKYTYRRDSVTIYGNVVRATHGETRAETLGSGDGSKALQQFSLRQSPLTYLSAPTAAGAVSTLQVRVNDILWHEADSLAGLSPTDRSYTTETDDASKTSVIFGNGQYGARLPTGVENVKAVYRSGIGKPGNVKAEQITLLATKPLGVKSVINPQRASGGADRESRDQARRNVSVALLALDRLVSVQDYADFARTYAGIGKASAVRLSDGRRQLVHLSIVGADNIPIDESSDLFQNLFQSLRLYGDPNEPLAMALAGVMFIIISARVRLLPDYALEFVEPKIRAALLDFFSFERRELGQPVFQSEVFSVIQSVPGVDYVELEIMDAVDQDRVIAALDKSQTTQPPGLSSLNLHNLPFVDVQLAHVDPNVTDPARRIVPAQMAFLNPDLPDTLILTELPK
jgi:hypothetical protein